MPELLHDEQLKVIAFYLPQFHAIPENDAAYGKGFTEWTNVRKAEPLFSGHNQPRVPLHGDYYSLTDVNVMIRQAQMAREHGVYGFCYYHYWFKNGKKLLEKPVERMLEEPRVDIPFCLCWANENWSKRWDGGNNEIIMEQDYGGEEEWRTHLQYLARFFADPRYIRVNGAPLLLIYRPELMPDCQRWAAFMKKEIKVMGFPGLAIAVQYPNYYLDGGRAPCFDYFVEFEPLFTRYEEVVLEKNPVRKAARRLKHAVPLADRLIDRLRGRSGGGAPSPVIRDYDKDWQTILARDLSDPRIIPGGFVDWDNTPRNKNGMAYRYADPALFRRYFSRLAAAAAGRKERCVFINAWNEWAEGAYLEPDEKYGFGYLDAIRDAVAEQKK